MSDFLTLDKRVKLKPYIPPPLKSYQLMTEQEIVNGQGGILIVDSESYLNYFLIAFKCVNTGKIIRLESGEELSFNPRMLSWILHNYMTVGFNSIKYDIPMLWASYKDQNPAWLQDISRSIIFHDQYPATVAHEYDFKIHDTNHIDLIEVCPLKGSLKLYGARLHSPRIQDLPFPIDIPLKPEQIPIVRDYCVNDLDETEELFKFLSDRLELRQAMSAEYRTNLMSKSDAQIAEQVISKELHKITGKWPKRPSIDPGTSYSYNIPNYLQFKTKVLQDTLEKVKTAKFSVNEFGSINLPKELDVAIPLNKAIYRMGIGGLHSYERNVAYKTDGNFNIIDRDVASYYPAIILNQRLYPEHMGENFLQIYEGLRARRLAAKASGNKTADKGLKVTINGSFGKFGSMYSVLYAPDLLIQVTITGQLSLLLLIEAIELGGIQVISANTDGIVMYCPQSLEGRLNEVIRDWEQQTGFITEETRYTAYYARDVNAYFAVKTSGEVKVKGPYSEVGSATGTQLDNNPASLICSDAVKALLSKGTPIEHTIRECKDITRFVTVRNVKGGAHKDNFYLGKVIRWYYSKNVSGTINYIISGNKVPETEGARPCQILPNELPGDINYEWYIQKSNEILEDIGYKPKSGQLKFF